MRLYYGRLLHAIHYSPAYEGKTNREGVLCGAYFFLQLVHEYCMIGIYEEPTIEAIIAKVKADGHQIWGSDVLDYAAVPNNAAEYILYEYYLKHHDQLSDAEIQEIFSLNLKREKAVEEKGE